MLSASARSIAAAFSASAAAASLIASRSASCAGLDQLDQLAPLGDSPSRARVVDLLLGLDHLGARAFGARPGPRTRSCDFCGDGDGAFLLLDLQRPAPLHLQPLESPARARSARHRAPAPCGSAPSRPPRAARICASSISRSRSAFSRRDLGALLGAAHGDLALLLEARVFALPLDVERAASPPPGSCCARRSSCPARCRCASSCAASISSVSRVRPSASKALDGLNSLMSAWSRLVSEAASSSSPFWVSASATCSRDRPDVVAAMLVHLLHASSVAATGPMASTKRPWTRSLQLLRVHACGGRACAPRPPPTRRWG